MTIKTINYTSDYGYTLERAHEHDAGMDIRSAVTKVLIPGGRYSFPTGIHIDIPPGYEVQVRSRSGLSLKNGIAVLNSPGSIDAGYTGEVCVILHNPSLDAYTVQKGDKIAQLVVKPVETPAPMLQTTINVDTERGDNGFGSTGK